MNGDTVRVLSYTGSSFFDYATLYALHVRHTPAPCAGPGFPGSSLCIVMRCMALLWCALKPASLEGPEKMFKEVHFMSALIETLRRGEIPPLFLCSGGIRRGIPLVAGRRDSPRNRGGSPE